MAGEPPFYADDPMEVYEKILSATMQVSGMFVVGVGVDVAACTWFFINGNVEEATFVHHDCWLCETINVDLI